MSTESTTTDPTVPDPTTSAVAVPTGLPPQTVGTAFQDYLDKLRGGDLGSVPAVAGLLVLVGLFSIWKPEQFFNVGYPPGENSVRTGGTTRARD